MTVLPPEWPGRDRRATELVGVGVVGVGGGAGPLEQPAGLVLGHAQLAGQPAPAGSGGDQHGHPPARPRSGRLGGPARPGAAVLLGRRPSSSSDALGPARRRQSWPDGLGRARRPWPSLWTGSAGRPTRTARWTIAPEHGRGDPGQHHHHPPRRQQHERGQAVPERVRRDRQPEQPEGEPAGEPPRRLPGALAEPDQRPGRGPGVDDHRQQPRQRPGRTRTAPRGRAAPRTTASPPRRPPPEQQRRACPRPFTAHPIRPGRTLVRLAWRSTRSSTGRVRSGGSSRSSSVPAQRRQVSVQVGEPLRRARRRAGCDLAGSKVSSTVRAGGRVAGDLRGVS